MRNALVYLTLTRLKNRIKALLKSPGKLIYVLFLLVLFTLNMFDGNTADSNRDLHDIKELFAILLTLYTVIFAFTAYNGFANGASMFTMPDVNLLFPAPLRVQRVLFYGLFQQLGTSMLLGFFLLFQYNWLHNLYGVGVGTLFLIIIGYTLTIFVGQVTAMVIYMFTSGDDRRKKLVELLFFGILGLFILYAAVPAFTGSSAGVVDRLVVSANTPIMRLLPVGGWMSGIAAGLLTGEPLPLVIGAALLIAFLAAMLCAISLSKREFYEDVLKNAEIAQSAITSRKEGTIGETTPQKIHVGKTGFRSGWGANAFFYKHLLENRRSRVFVFSMQQLIFVVVIIGFAFITGKEGGIWPTFAFATYMQIFSIALGRLNKELTKPYIYLVPESPLAKLVWNLMESLPTAAIEAVIVFVPVGLLVQLSPIEILCCILARLSFAMLFTAGNVVVERLWGGVVSKMLVILLYMLVMFLLVLPGLILAIALLVANVALFSVTTTMLLAFTVANIPMTLLALFLCRNMLQYAELNQQ